MIFKKSSKKLTLGSANSKQKLGRTPKSKLPSRTSSYNPRSNTAKPHTKPSKVKKPIGPGTQLGASSSAPIVIDSDDEDLAHDQTVSAGAYVPGSLIAPSNTTSGLILQQDLSRFRYTSNLPSPAPSSSKMIYPPSSHIFSPNPTEEFFLRRYTPALSVTQQSEVSNRHHHNLKTELHPEEKRQQRRSYPTPSVTIGVDVSERESSIFMSASRPRDHERRATSNDTGPSQPLSSTKLNTIGRNKHRDVTDTGEPRRVPRLSKASLSNLSGTHHDAPNERGDGDGEELMVKLERDDPAFEFDTDASDATDATELELAEKRRRLAQAKSTQRPTKDTSKVTKSCNVRKPTKPVRSKRDYRPKMGITKSNRPSIARKRCRNSIDRDFLVSDNEFYVESDYSSGDSSSDEGRKNNSDIEMKDLDDDCADLRINLTKKYAFNAGILKKKGQTSGK